MREIAYNGDLKVLRSAQDDKVTEKDNEYKDFSKQRNTGDV